jgi:hypothetical protein
MTNLSDRNVDLRRPGLDAPGLRPSIDSDLNLQPPVIDELSPRARNSTTWIIAVVAAVLIVGAIVYGFSGTMHRPVISPTTAPQTTDPATPATAPPKAP